MCGLKRLLVMLLGLVLSQATQAQGWELSFGGNKEDQGQAVIQTNDHGFLIAGFSEAGLDNDLDIYLIRTDVDGTLIWEETYDLGFIEHAYGIIQTEDKGFLVVGDIIEMVGQQPSVLLMKVSKDGKFEWSKIYGTPDVLQQGNGIAESLDGGYMIIGRTKATATGEDDILLIKVDDQGNEIWSRTYGGDFDDEGTAIVTLQDGYAFVGNMKDGVGPDKDIVIYRIDPQGDVIWAHITIQTPLNEEANDLVLTPEGNLVLVGSIETFSLAFVAKYDLSGTVKWFKGFGLGLDNEARAVIALADGSIVLTGYTVIDGINFDIFLAKLDPNGNEVWVKGIGDDLKVDTGEGLAATVDGGFVITGYNAKDFFAFNDVTLIKTDGLGNTRTNFISGKVFHDLQGCGNGLDTEDVRLEDWLVIAQGQSAAYFGTTGPDGSYGILVDTGRYEVTVIPTNGYWELCNPEGYIIDFQEFYDTTALVDFPVSTGISCPFMEVDVSAEFLTICEDVDYTVAYCNLGTATAENAYVEVVLDEDLTFVSATIPGTQNGNVFTFELGDLISTECGSFTIKTMMACEGIATGQAGLVSAHIYPDSICFEPDPDWDMASIIVSGQCEDGTLKFSIINAGDGQMTEPLDYFIVEDDLMFLNGQFDLGPGEPEEIIFEGTGATYRIVAQQSQGHPGMSNPTLAVEGCVTGAISYSTGQVTQFPENDQDPFISIDVQEAVGSGLPIEMRGYPKGLGENHLVAANTDLIYHIYFENTGTDTITRVVIRDTLPAGLDFTKVMPGSSSHPYDFQIYNNGILKITFDGIQLQPGGSAEGALTRGFVKFRIAQKPDNPSGTIIDNSAVVYFDYHDPVQTNVVRHEVGCGSYFDFEDGCILVSTTNDTVFVPGATIKVYPNPFFDVATFEVEGHMVSELNLQVFDLTGRLIRKDSGKGNKLDFYRRHLPSGMYTFQLLSERQIIGAGKIVVR
jgi:uncharacterized repeat protein (TIGR01451 family)